MTSTDLPWRVRGRVLRPYAFAVSIATAVVTYSILAGVALGRTLDGTVPGVIVGLAGAGASVLLWVGWWAKSDRWMRWGLFWTTGVWASVWTILSFDVGWWNVSTMLAGCWAMASGGAWLLEVSNHPRPPVELGDDE